MMRRFCFALTILLVLPCIGQATTYDLTADFGDTNPNGQWSYGWKEAIGGAPIGTLHLFQNYTLDWHQNWSGEGYYSDGSGSWGGGEAWKNLDSSGHFGIDPGQISINSDSYCTSTVRWTAPSDGSVNISGWYGGGDLGVGARAVFHNADELWKVCQSAGSFDFTGLSVAAGDTIDFTVWGGGSGGNTPVGATIDFTAVPEPSALLALLTGLGVPFWGAVARRRRR